MKRNLFLISFLLFSLIIIQAQTNSIHQFKVKDINGDIFDMSSLKGKKVLVVNVASKCGLTPQYEQLQELYDKYKDTGFTIIGFPSNNFANQEPGSNSEIKAFCTENYGVTFLMMDKVSTKGNDQSPIYQWLTKKSKNGVLDAEVSWNFQKFMIDENGRLMQYLAELAPKGNRRMGANPHTNGGILLKDLHMPDFHKHALHVPFVVYGGLSIPFDLASKVRK